MRRILHTIPGHEPLNLTGGHMEDRPLHEDPAAMDAAGAAVEDESSTPGALPFDAEELQQVHYLAREIAGELRRDLVEREGSAKMDAARRLENGPEFDESAVAKIAQLCHEANGYYCYLFTGEDQPGWEDAPDWQKESAIDGVRKHLGYGHMSPEESHNAWMSHKLRDGWRYGEVKDAEQKTHPCLLPFPELPHEQQLKDRLFGSIVQALGSLAYPHLRRKMEEDARPGAGRGLVGAVGFNSTNHAW